MDDYLAGILEGDTRTLRAFEQCFSGKLRAWAMQVVSNTWDADEVVQDTLMTIAKKSHLFRGESSYSTWIFRVLQNHGRMLLRKKKRIPTPIDGDALNHFVDTYHGASSVGLTAGPDEYLKVFRQQANLAAGLANLSEQNRRLYLRLEVDGCERSDLSEELGLSDGAIKVRLHRIRNTLKQSLEMA